MISSTRRTGLQWTVTILLLLAGTSPELQAQATVEYSAEGGSVPISNADGKLSWDTILDAPYWQQLEPLPLVQYEPSYGDSMSERTEIRLSHDESYLYVYGRMYDSSPGDVRVNSLYRNRESGDDLMTIVIDAFNDNETGMGFSVNPAGVRIDFEISDDAEGRGVLNMDWNTFWDAQARETDFGWEAAMRIPFASLGFQSGDEPVEMSMIAQRLIARKNERHIYPDIPPDWRRGFVKPSQAQRMSMDGIGEQNPVYITPYGLGGLDQINQPVSGNGAHDMDAESGYTLQNDYTHEAGLDVRYPVTSNLTLDLTLNTDFAQVEADEQQLDLDRFSLFFPEKRQFFQERANIFEFNTGGPSRLFYSRRIGLREGEPIRILGGARLAGRSGPWDIGLLNMQTERRSDLNLPTENFGVVRLRRQVFSPHSYAGGIVTSRLGGDGSYNISTGLDGRFLLYDDDFLTYRFAQTFDHRLDTGWQDPLDNSILYVQWSRQRSQGFNYTFTYKRTGEHYEPEMGFEQRDFFTMLFTRLDYGTFPDSDASLRRLNAGLQTITIWRNEDGTLESFSLQQPLSLQLPSGSRLEVSGRYWIEDLRSRLSFNDDVYVPEGNYSFYGGEVQYNMADGMLLRSDLTLGYNTFYDGTRFSVEAEPVWNLSRHLELGGSIELSRLDFPERDQQMDAFIARFRTLFSLDQHLSLEAFTQFDNVNERLLNNVRFRYNFREGNDLWIVYNESQNTRLTQPAPSLPRLDGRSIMVKYTYTFRM